MVSGTNRIGSLSLKVAKNLERRYKALGATTTLLNLQDLPLELFSPQSYKSKPEGFASFQDAILSSRRRGRGRSRVQWKFSRSAGEYFIDMLKYPGSF